MSKRRKLEVKALELMKNLNDNVIPGKECITISTPVFSRGIEQTKGSNFRSRSAYLVSIKFIFYSVSFQGDSKLVDLQKRKKQKREAHPTTKKEMRNYGCPTLRPEYLGTA